jgi:hypothetical protein
MRRGLAVDEGVAHVKRPQKWKQLLLHLGVYLLLGAIVTVAVAWGCALWSPRADAQVSGRTALRQRVGATDKYQFPDNQMKGTHVSEYVITEAGLPSRSMLVNLSSNTFVTLFASRPHWPGFAINTIFYAAMLWLLWIAPGKIRRFIRVHRGRCPACGYQIAPGGGIGPVCSECGAALPAAWSTNASP